MARAPDKSYAGQFKTTDYIQSWAANNPYYAPHVTWEFDTMDTRRTQAAARSGIVRSPGYSNISPENRGYDQRDMRNWARPEHPSSAPYDYLGNVKKQRGDVQLGLVMMGGYQFPGQAFRAVPGKSGFLMPNRLAKWMNEQGIGGYSPEGRRFRRSGGKYRDRGWEGTLSQSMSSNKGPGGFGQSSEDSTVERYSTQETRMGTRAIFTDEEFDEETKKFGRTWAGFRPLSTHSRNPHFNSALGQMFQSKNTDTGFARRRSI